MSAKSPFFRRYVWPRWPWLLLATLLTLVVGLAAAPVPALLGPAIQVVANPDGPPLVFAEALGPTLGHAMSSLVGAKSLAPRELMAILPLILLACAGIKALAGALHWFAFEWLGEAIALRMRQDLVNLFLSIDPATRQATDAKDPESQLTATAINDVRAVREYFVHYYGGFPREFAQIVVLVFQLVQLSPKLFLLFLVGVAPLAILLNSLGRKLRRRAQKSLNDFSELGEWLQQRLLGMETIKHYRTEELELSKMRRLNTELRKTFIKTARVKSRTSPIIEAVVAIAVAAVLVLALSDVAEGRASGAAQLSFLSTLAMLSQSASKLGKYLNSNREGSASLSRLGELESALASRRLEQLPRTVDPQGLRPALVLRDVSLTYPGSERPALQGFSYRFVAGQLYCLIGPSGAGKSTLLQVMLGLLRPDRGEVVFTGLGPDWSQKDSISYMPQKVQLMPGSIADNVCYPETECHGGRLEESLSKVNLTEFCATLPHGPRELIGEEGRVLSGGQAQRVLLARLWYRQTPFVLIDEGTSALDPETERLIYAVLRDLVRGGAVVIMIAHRPQAAAIADTLLVINHGQLTAVGPSQELLATPKNENFDPTNFGHYS